MILIDAVRYGFLEPMLKGHRIGVAPSARDEVRFWKDANGVRRQIDLTPYVEAGLLDLVGATSDDLAQIVKVVSSNALGAGELESLAVVVARGERFCTVDGRAIRAMTELGVADKHVALRDLLGTLDPPVDVPEDKYR
jgi:hypothetical protein